MSTELNGELAGVLLGANAYDVTPTEITGSYGDVEALVFPLPADYTLHTHVVLHDKERPAPLRNCGTIVVKDTRSLIAYVAKHKTEGTEFYADAERGTVTAVLNAPNGPAGPAWADHRVVLALTVTDTWKAWAGGSGNYLPQEAFADFFEDQTRAFKDPDAATMLDVAQNFHASTDRTFASKVRIASGQIQFTHNEVTTERVGDSETMEVPKTFVLQLKVWESTRLLDVPVLFRYRIQHGKLALGWKLNQQTEIKRDVFDALVLDLADALGTDTDEIDSETNVPVREFATIFTGPAPEYRTV